MTQGIRSCIATRLMWHDRPLCLVVSIVFACVLMVSAISASEAPFMPLEPPAAEPQEPITPIPLSLALDPPRVALGERLFHDVRLSHDNTRACTTCHPLQRGGMDGRPRAITANGTLHPRNTPTIFNVSLSAAFNWDGIANTLEAHAEIVLLNPSLMHTTWPELLAKLQADADYVTRFNTAYAGGLTPASVLDALASFERSLLTPNARFDRYLREEKDALTAPEQQGYRLFKSYGCVACHQGMNIGGNMYLTYVGQTLDARVEAEPAIAADIAALSHVLLRFTHTPELRVGQEVEAALQRLSDVPRFPQDLHTLVAHGRLMVALLPQVDTLLRQIIAAPTAAHAASFQDAVLQYTNRAEARAQRFRVLLYLVAVMLLRYLLYQFARLRAHARDLRRANADLQREMGERQQAVCALRASEERFRAITESANDAIISADSAGCIVSWNARAEAIFGYTAAEILSAPLTRLIPARDQEAHGQRVTQWSATGAAHLIGTTTECSGVRKDGSAFPLEMSLSTWSTAYGHYVTGIIRDLTAHKQLQETTRQQRLQLIQANKMTALGTLVSGVAHEINNPNQVVLMNAKMLATAWDDAADILDTYEQDNGTFALAGLPYTEMRDTLPALVRDMHDSALRIERIIDDLKDFARPRVRGVHTVVQLNDAVQRALRLLGHFIKQHTDHLHVDLAQGLPSVRGDAQHIEQIVVNLLTNALEALPDRRHGVTVTTARDLAQRCVLLEVRDEGVGIPPEHLARVCDAFFTTKHESGGTGLGLAITASLVRVHGGGLTFASELGKGTCTRVTLPCHDAEQLPPRTLASAHEEKSLP